MSEINTPSENTSHFSLYYIIPDESISGAA